MKNKTLFKYSLHSVSTQKGKIKVTLDLRPIIFFKSYLFW